MNLHRAERTPQWTTVPTTERNRWQRLANRTNGVATLGNFFTVIGLILVVVGILLVGEKQYWIGLILVLIGRMCDIWDGMAAEKTGTKSPLGEALDAGFDKLACIAAFIILTATGIIPWLVALLLLLPNLSNASITYYAGRKSIAIHPARSGKLFMAALWVSLVCYMLLPPLKLADNSWLGIVGAIFLIIALVLGGQASASYIRDVRAK